MLFYGDNLAHIAVAVIFPVEFVYVQVNSLSAVGLWITLVNVDKELAQPPPNTTFPGVQVDVQYCEPLQVVTCRSHPMLKYPAIVIVDVAEVKLELLDTPKDPATSSFALGAVVPMPTLPPLK